MTTGRAIATASAIPSLAWLTHLNPGIVLGFTVLFVGLLVLLFCRSAEPHRRFIELIGAIRTNPASPAIDSGSTPCVVCRSAT